jgi:heat shock protein HslJ
MRLTEYRAPDGAIVTVLDEVAATATFADGRVAGSTGCNRFTATYTAQDRDLSIGPVATTLMTCLPEREAIERAMTTGLAAAVHQEVVGDTLELTDAAGAVTLRLRAAPALPLVGTAWVAIGINNGRGGLVSALEDVSVTTTLDEAGAIAGSGGCNRYSGPYRIDGDAITIGPLRSTRMACAAPEGIDEQEAAFLAALERVATWTIREGRLQLRDAEGALQADFRVTAAGEGQPQATA